MVKGFKFMPVRLMARCFNRYGENVLHSISLQQKSRLGFHAACIARRCRMPAIYLHNSSTTAPPNAQQTRGVREATSSEQGFLELLLERAIQAIQPIQSPRPRGDSLNFKLRWAPDPSATHQERNKTSNSRRAQVNSTVDLEAGCVAHRALRNFAVHYHNTTLSRSRLCPASSHLAHATRTPTPA